MFALSARTKATVQALFVTFLWSTSWVLIKFGLDEIPALTFAGLRYAIAAAVLVPFIVRRIRRTGSAGRHKLPWRRLIVLGVTLYAVTQGAQFLALERLPAQTTSLILSFSPVVVAFLAAGLLSERIVAVQWWGVAGYLVGATLFLYPAGVPGGAALGVVIAITGLVGNAAAAIMGRSVNRDGSVDPFVVTGVSMGIGAVILLVSGIATNGLPMISATGWLIIGWLAMVNTAFAFVLWNITLRTLPAVESSVINNTMLIQIAVLAWVFLDESLSARELLGLLIAAIGVLIVQLRPGRILCRAR